MRSDYANALHSIQPVFYSETKRGIEYYLPYPLPSPISLWGPFEWEQNILRPPSQFNIRQRNVCTPGGHCKRVTQLHFPWGKIYFIQKYIFRDKKKKKKKQLFCPERVDKILEWKLGCTIEDRRSVPTYLSRGSYWALSNVFQVSMKDHFNSSILENF